MTTAFRGLVVAGLALALAAGCSAADQAKPKPVGGAYAATGAPSGLTQIKGAKGQELPLGGGLSLVVPEGSTSKPMTSSAKGSKFLLYDMPDANANGFPQLQFIWGPSDTKSAEASWAREALMKVNPAVSNFKRSSVKWPGADNAFVATWTEKVTMGSSTFVGDALALWFDAPDGTVGFAAAFAPTGELDGSTALSSLRSLTIG